MLAIHGKDVHAVFGGESAYQVAGHDKGLLVGKADGLACLYGVDCGRKSCESHHGGEHHVDGLCLHYLVESLVSGVDLDVGHVGKQLLQSLVVLLVGYDYGCRTVFACLLGKHFIAVVGREAVGFVAVGMLAYHIESLCSDAAGGTKDTYLFLHNC